jgi:hypothetical protein
MISRSIFRDIQDADLRAHNLKRQKHPVVVVEGKQIIFTLVPFRVCTGREPI